MQLFEMLIQSWREKVLLPSSPLTEEESEVETVLQSKKGKNINKKMAECPWINQTV